MAGINGSERSVRLAQAQGMVSAQVGCTVDDALILMSARARFSHVAVEKVAVAIVAGKIRFDDAASGRSRRTGLIGVNPAGEQHDLRYDIEIGGVVGTVEVRREGPNEFSFDTPRTKGFVVSCYVRDINDPTMYDGQAVAARLIPVPL